MSADAGFDWFRAKAAEEAEEARSRIRAVQEAHRVRQDAVNAAAIDADACPLCWCLGTGGALCGPCAEAAR